MWKALLLCALVALSAAEQHRGAWKENIEYRYQVRTQTLAAIPNLKNQWTGLFTKADLALRRISENTLSGKLYNGEYSEWHDALPEGPTKYQPDNQLTYQSMKLSAKPFEIRLNNGAVHSLAVSPDMTNVELNQLKSIVSQLQVDIQARNEIKSPRTHLPLNQDNEDNDSQALYSVMEPTVTGKCETIYDISRVPLYMAQAYPEINNKMPLNKDDAVYEVIKNKNYSNCEQRMGYHFGVSGLNNWKPNTNEMGSLSKSAVSRVVITGQFEKYTIRSSVTTNRVVKANPDKEAQQDSMIVSQVNVTLASMEENDGKPLVKSDKLIDVGNLVYSYDMPSDKKNALRPKKDSSESQEDDEEELNWNQFQKDNVNQPQYYQRKSEKKSRSARSTRDYQSQYEQQYNDNANDFWDSAENKEYLQPKPTLKNAPENPMSYYSIGNKGSSIQSDKDFNAPAEVEKLAREIAQDLNNPNEVPVKQTLRKFNILSKIIRTMSAKQIEETTRSVVKKQENQEQDNGVAQKAVSVYRDALASAGTGPAVSELMKWIEEGKLTGEEAVEVIASFPKNIREPTKEMQKLFFEFVKNDNVKQQQYVNNAAGIAFTRFMYQAQVNHKFAKKFYPVEAYAHVAERNNKFVEEEVVPYFAGLLKEAIQEKDAPKTLYAIRALGNLGHSEVPKVFEPYFNGEVREVTDFQRLAMVLALDKYSSNLKETARTIYMKIYQNKGETHEIRAAAVFGLMTTNPSAAQLQRMAEETNNEESNDVRAAVKSALESAARLTTPEMAELAKKAKSALSLLKPEQQGLQYSRTQLRDYVVREMEASYKQTSSYIVNKDSFIPNGIFAENVADLGGFKQRSEFQATVSSVEELVNFVHDNIKSRKSDNENSYENENQYNDNESSKWTGEKIMKMLNMKSNKADKLEGQILIDFMNSERFFTFDKTTLEQLTRKVKNAAEKLRNGYELKYTKLGNQKDVEISFPLETGFPFTFAYRKPVAIQVEGRVEAQTNYNGHKDQDDQIEMPEKINVKANIKATFSVQSEITMTFVNPSTRQRYTVGYDKKFQVYVPVRVNSEMNFSNGEITAEVQPLEEDKETKLIQLGSWPYTSRDYLLNLRPLPLSKNTKEIHGAPVREMKRTYGQKQTGFAFKVRGTHEKDANQVANVLLRLSKYDIFSVFLFNQESTAPEHYSLDVSYDGTQSTSKSVKLTVKYNKEKNYENQEQQEQADTKFHPRSMGQSAEGSDNLAKPQSYAPNSQSRRQQFLQNAAQGMAAHTYARVVDVSVEFNGSQKRQYIATLSGALSKPEGKARVLAFAQKANENEETQEVYLQADAKYKPVNEFQESNSDAEKPFANVKFQLGYGFQQAEVATIRGEVKAKQSDELKEQVNRMENNQEFYRNAVDHFDAEIDFNKANKEILEREFSFKTSNLYNYLRYSTVLFLNEDFEYKGDKNKVSFEVRLSPEFQAANVTMKTENMKSEWKSVPVPKYFKKLVIPSKYNVIDEIKRHVIQNRDTCQIVENTVSTFENSTVDNVELNNNNWYLAVHKMRNHQEHEKENGQRVTKHVSVLVRNAGRHSHEKKKEVMIVLHQNAQKDITVRLSPNQEQSNDVPRVYVDDKEETLQNQMTKAVHSTDDAKKVLANVYVVKRGAKGSEKHEVKVETKQGNLEVTYDGKNVQIQSKGMIRNNRGICGAFAGQQTNDLRSPDNKIMRNGNDFVNTWALVDGANQQSQYKNMQYAKEEVSYGNPIPNEKRAQKQYNNEYEQESNEREQRKPEQQNQQQQHQQQNQQQKQQHATKHQTQYVEDHHNSRICFSTRPLPVCAPGTRANGKMTQKVDVYCRNINDPAAQQYKQQIQSGRNLDMSKYETHAQLKFTVPKRCEQY